MLLTLSDETRSLKQLVSLYKSFILFSCYSAPSNLWFGETALISAEGVQQGAPAWTLTFLLSYPSISCAAKVRVQDLVPG